MSEFSVFEDAEAEYKRYCDTVRARLADYGDVASEGDIRTLQNDYKAAKECIRTMDMEVRGFRPKAVKETYSGKVKLYKSVLSDLNQDLERLKNRSSRASLMAGSSDMELTASVSHREWLLAQTDKTRTNRNALEDAARTIAETQDVAVGITSELARNRETILAANRKAKQTTSLTSRARKLVQGMRRRNMYTKAMLCFFILLMLIVISLVMYFAFFSGSGNNPTTNTPTNTGSGSS